MVRAETTARKNSVFAHFGQWKTDPAGFIEKALYGHLWSKQREIVLSVLKNRRTAVKSCHDVGKSWIASRVGAWWLSCFDPGSHFLVSLAPTFQQVRGILWREINKAHAIGGLPGHLNQTEWWMENELVGFGRSPADTDPTSIQGIHAPAVLLLGDEACGLAKAILDAADSLIANDDSRALLIGNPDDPSTEFERICRPGSGWNVIEISAFDSPNFTGEAVPDSLRPLLISKTWVEEKRKSWGVGSMLWASKIMGQFPEQASDSLIPVSAIKAAIMRYENAIDGEPCEFGIDVARMGDDSSVIYMRRGYKARCVHRHHKRDLMELVGQIIRLCRLHKPSRIKIDDNGMGGGVTDRLRELQASTKADDKDAAAALKGVEIIPINVGEGPSTDTADERFKNKRAEINWGLRILFTEENPKIAVEENDDLLNQSTQIKYKMLSSGEIQIEPKADMKKRTKGVSPDDWDALVLCFAAPSFAGFGVMEYYARQAAALKQQGLANPFGNVAAAPTDRVRMKAPPGISTIYGTDGVMYQVENGEVLVASDDVNPFIGQGFTKA